MKISLKCLIKFSVSPKHIYPPTPNQPTNQPERHIITHRSKLRAYRLAYSVSRFPRVKTQFISPDNWVMLLLWATRHSPRATTLFSSIAPNQHPYRVILTILRSSYGIPHIYTFTSTSVQEHGSIPKLWLTHFTQLILWFFTEWGGEVSTAFVCGGGEVRLNKYTNVDKLGSAWTPNAAIPQGFAGKCI